MANLDIIALRKRFGAVEILKGIDITLEKGGFLVLVGPSGCGKSTLLNTIAGLESISAGEIRIGGKRGQRPASLEARHRHGVPVLRALSQHVGRREHRLRHGDARRAEGGARRRRSPRVAKTLQIEHLLDRRPSQLIRRPAPARRDGPGAGAQALRSSCSTSRSPISTPSCASTCASRSSACIRPPAPRSSM